MNQDSFALAVEYHQAGRIDEAERIYREILAADPENPDALHLLGMAAHDCGRHEQAAALIGHAITVNPWVSYYHSNLGNVLQSLQRFSDAVLCYEEALRLEPECPEAHNNLGNALRHLGCLDQSILSLVEAVRLRPDYFQAYRNLGETLAAKGLFAEAAACYREVLRIQPDLAEVHLALSHALLVTGDFQSGWEEFEWRWRLANCPAISFAQPLWDGSPLEGKTILLWAEQGLGDTIQFVRYATLAAALGGRVIVECQSSLKRLIETLPGVVEVVAFGNTLPPFDVHAPLQSLPYILHTTVGTIPATVPYFRVAPEWREGWSARTGGAPGFKVGLVWAGSRMHTNDRNRSIPPEVFAPLAQIAGVAWFSLQKDPPGAAPPLPFFDLRPYLGDFADTAAALTHLDLVISADTSVAHLAGALGKPVWTLIPFAPDYRWLLERADTPWYPGMRLIRQPEPGNWPAVIASVAGLLHARVSTNSCIPPME